MTSSTFPFAQSRLKTQHHVHVFIILYPSSQHDLFVSLVLPLMSEVPWPSLPLKTTTCNFIHPSKLSPMSLSHPSIDADAGVKLDVPCQKVEKPAPLKSGDADAEIKLDVPCEKVEKPAPLKSGFRGPFYPPS
ncbi:hypothetical protein O6H91_06G028000 [Diphasiastrum complanatum]|uniref:Uncharacterized protein n=1 Tax=Diphasiastrum complanatum TaxID=34168 RepID=A0ACC2DC06_DIPCM|nr:hypothetical protein O6H91_06G028000 [Diphasiastrum complanatum]